MNAFESTDDTRSDKSLSDKSLSENSLRDKSLTHVQTVTFEGPVPLERGADLPRVTCAFETWGTLNDDASNAILICHAISGDSHAARHDANDAPGWWDTLIGPGKAIDTDRFFVICPNVLGGCRGSTGPSDPMPECSPARPFGADFPDITIDDMVNVQKRLLDSLGISELVAVVGGSLGGHQALTWARRYPNCLRACIALATSPRLTSQALGFDVVARNAIQTDPHFNGGQYYDQIEKPDTGLAIARMLGHITYLSSDAMEGKFELDRHDPREIASDFEQKFSKFTDRFDANSYITLSMAMDLFDLGRSR
ncbi:UNVERIFIED_CONTAM: hypothetical protein GTU68_021390, partial [Idotea baltica]|nr:hypothetical protein [Idotea baltica]